MLYLLNINTLYMLIHFLLIIYKKLYWKCLKIIQMKRLLLLQINILYMFIILIFYYFTYQNLNAVEKCLNY